MDKDPNICVIPNSYEKYMSFSIGNLKFIDSIQFMASSLEQLVENLHNDNPTPKYDNFHFMKQEFGDDISLVCQKGFYPYEWMDDSQKLDQQGLPNIESFYSQLSQKSISPEDYTHAQNVYTKMNYRTFQYYHLLLSLIHI